MDIRVTNTKTRIQHGLLACLTNNSLIKLHDKDIIKKAEVSSATFYKYYSDKAAVLADIEKQLNSEYHDAMQHDLPSWHLNHVLSKEDVKELVDSSLNRTIDYFRVNQTAITTLMGPNGDAAFMVNTYDQLAKIISGLVKYYERLVGNSQEFSRYDQIFELLSAHFASAVLNPLLFWLNHPNDMSLRDTKELMKQSLLNSPYDLSVLSFK